jgi:hypothetical protein
MWVESDVLDAERLAELLEPLIWRAPATGSGSLGPAGAGKLDRGWSRKRD